MVETYGIYPHCYSFNHNMFNFFSYESGLSSLFWQTFSPGLFWPFLPIEPKWSPWVYHVFTRAYIIHEATRYYLYWALTKTILAQLRQSSVKFIRHWFLPSFTQCFIHKRIGIDVSSIAQSHVVYSRWFPSCRVNIAYSHRSWHSQPVHTQVQPGVNRATALYSEWSRFLTYTQ